MMNNILTYFIWPHILVFEWSQMEWIAIDIAMEIANIPNRFIFLMGGESERRRCGIKESGEEREEVESEMKRQKGGS